MVPSRKSFVVRAIEWSSVLQRIALYPFPRRFPTRFSSFATCDKRNSTEDYSLSSSDSCLNMLIDCVVRGSVVKKEYVSISLKSVS